MTRQEQKELRKKEIMMAAMELFVKQGYYETKISDIAKKVQMSVGLLFHYFESKEQLYLELVQMGAAATKQPEQYEHLAPEEYFDFFLKQVFLYSKEQPWVFQMFILMGQARREGMPQEARDLACSINQIEHSTEIIKRGQASGVFKEGDPYQLSVCFWSSVQGVMEQIALEGNTFSPDPSWLTSILMK